MKSFKAAMLKERIFLFRNFSKTLDDLSWPTPLRPPYKLEVKEKLGGFQQACRHLLLLKA